MNIIGWFTDPAHWTGSGSIPMQVGYHLLYSAIALLVALAIGVPLGILIGYTGRGETLVAKERARLPGAIGFEDALVELSLDVIGVVPESGH